MNDTTSPSPPQPGSLAEQLAAIALYLRLPIEHRKRFRAAAWQAAREAAIPHARLPRRDDLRRLLPPLDAEPEPATVTPTATSTDSTPLAIRLENERAVAHLVKERRRAGRRSA